MKEFYQIIKTSSLFEGITDQELDSMLSCLGAKTETYQKNSFILRTGDIADSIGLVLCGSILIIQEDYWGNRNIISKVGPGESFASSFACAYLPLNVSAIADSPTMVMYLNVKRILNVCSNTCTYHNKILRNLLGELASKNIKLGEKVMHTSQRTTRAKLMSYLSAEAQRVGKYEFDIPYSRQQLADYLSVERSGLSLELSKMKDEGLLDYKKNHFRLLKTFKDVTQVSE